MIGAVDLSGLDRVFHLLDSGQEDHLREFCKRYPPELAKFRRSFGLHPVAVNGSATRGLKMGYFETRLRDGTVGYFQRRVDDCLQAAIASCLQIPPHKVPDLRIEELLDIGKEPEEIERIIGQAMRLWCRQIGIDFIFHSTPPISERRWIGVVSGGGDGFFDHCLLMNRGDPIFDGASLLPSSKDRPVTQHDPADIDYGITIIERSF